MLHFSCQFDQTIKLGLPHLCFTSLLTLQAFAKWSLLSTQLSFQLQPMLKALAFYLRCCSSVIIKSLLDLCTASAQCEVQGIPDNPHKTPHNHQLSSEHAEEAVWADTLHGSLTPPSSGFHLQPPCKVIKCEQHGSGTCHLGFAVYELCDLVITLSKVQFLPPFKKK